MVTFLPLAKRIHFCHIFNEFYYISDFTLCIFRSHSEYYSFSAFYLLKYFSKIAYRTLDVYAIFKNKDMHLDMIFIKIKHHFEQKKRLLPQKKSYNMLFNTQNSVIYMIKHCIWCMYHIMVTENKSVLN